MVTSDTIAPYNRGFREFSAAFETFGFADIHRGALPYLPQVPGVMLDVGAGSGRDSAWFAERGWDVVAVEPASAMRAEAARRHPLPNIRWLDDSLPALASVHRLGITFDLVWLSGVWMHIPEPDRPRAMRKLATLLKPGGRLVLTLRHGPSPDNRPMWPVAAFEVERLGLDMGLALRVATNRTEDMHGNKDVHWQTTVLDLPDDGAGALPLLRGVILNQEKSATYKLALLRCIARIADSSPNVARDCADFVEIPLGLIALYWIRMFKPLFDRGLPQRPGDKMGFVTDAFRALAPVAPFDLRPGAFFTDAQADALRRALKDAARLIATMPARHLTFADDRPVFQTRYGAIPKPSAVLLLDQECLWHYGRTLVPLGIWTTLRRMAAWIEPMLVAEWVRLTQGYAVKLRKRVTADDVIAALRWVDPQRDTSLVRALTQQRLKQGHEVQCVWTGRSINLGSFDIDHCLPWSAWPCGDLWNLLPATASVNRHSKGERIVSSATLVRAKPFIMRWWCSAYVDAAPMLRKRFMEEAQSTLPVLKTGNLDLEDLFLALDFRRLRLRQDTHLSEWAGSPHQPGAPPL